MSKEKTNFEILEGNREAVLVFSSSIKSQESLTAPGIETIKRLTLEEDFSKAIESLDQLKDNKLGIAWHKSNDLGNGTKALVRDARGITTDPKILKIDAGEKYAMQILNETRAAITLLEGVKFENDQTKELAKKKLKDIALSSLDDIENLPANIKKYNTKLVDALEEVGVPKASKRLNFAKEIENFKDEHRHIVTLTTAKDKEGVSHTVIEAEIMLNGLTKSQKEQWEAIANTSREKPNTKLPNMEWYNNLSKHKKNLLREVAAEVATGNKVIPTQLLKAVPGIKNAYQKITAIKSPDKKAVILSQSLHCGTPATKIKRISEGEKQNIVDENINQLRTFVAPKKSLNLNILSSGAGSESFVQEQLRDSAVNLREDNFDVQVSQSSINRGRLLGVGTEHTVFKEILDDIGRDIQKNDKTKNIGSLIRGKSSLLENIVEKVTFAAKKSTETRAKNELTELAKTDPALAKDLEHTIKARKLIDDPVWFIKGNANIKRVAAVDMVENSVKRGALSSKGILSDRTKDNLAERIDFCKSGKDRTGYLNTKITHETISNYLGVEPSSELGQDNLLRQVAGGHTQEMAGIQGGTIGCHAIKTGLGTSIDKEDQRIEGVINQKSSKFNSKIKVTKKKKAKKRVSKKPKEKLKEGQNLETQVVKEKEIPQKRLELEAEVTRPKRKIYGALKPPPTPFVRSSSQNAKENIR